MAESNRTILTDSGREINIMEAGTLDGTPILVESGAPGSRTLYHLWIEDALSRGIRLISYDRPGYGASTPNPGRNVASAATDVASIAKSLGINRLSVYGLSGGGPHALACAALLPDLVVAVAALASPAPYNAEGLDWFAGMSEEVIIEFRAAIAGREKLEPLAEAFARNILSSDVTSFVQTMRPQLNPFDVNGDYAEFGFSHLREGIRDRRDGYIDDFIALIKPWGFEPRQINIPVLLCHGKRDQNIPPSHWEWLTKQIPNADARLSPDDGHIPAARSILDVHSWLLAKMTGNMR